MTGGSDGIGREFAKDLAKKGFDVAISSRSQSKLDSVKSEIETLYPDRRVKTFSIDYSKSPDYSVMTEDPEISPKIIVNNVGYFNVCSIFKETPENL